jgi:hypothetical protein
VVQNPELGPYPIASRPLRLSEYDEDNEDRHKMFFIAELVLHGIRMVVKPSFVLSSLRDHRIRRSRSIEGIRTLCNENTARDPRILCIHREDIRLSVSLVEEHQLRIRLASLHPPSQPRTNSWLVLTRLHRLPSRRNLYRPWCP